MEQMWCEKCFVEHGPICPMDIIVEESRATERDDQGKICKEHNRYGGRFSREESQTIPSMNAREILSILTAVVEEVLRQNSPRSRFRLLDDSYPLPYNVRRILIEVYLFEQHNRCLQVQCQNGSQYHPNP